MPFKDLDPEKNPNDVIGAVWDAHGVTYRRVKNGQVMRKTSLNKWILCEDPTRPPSVWSTKRSIKAVREGRTPFMENLPLQDKIRMKLREVAHRLDGEGAELRLTRTLPGVQALSFAIRYLDGGRNRFVELVQLAALNNHPIACKWYAVYADLELYERLHASLDDICAAAGITPDILMGCLVSTGMKQGIDVGNLVAAALHPEIVKQSAASATRIVGEYTDIALEDRRMMFQHHNFIPVPKGTTINISANAKAAAAASAEPTVPKFAEDVTVDQPAVPEFLQRRERKTVSLAADGQLIGPERDE